MTLRELRQEWALPALPALDTRPDLRALPALDTPIEVLDQPKIFILVLATWMLAIIAAKMRSLNRKSIQT